MANKRNLERGKKFGAGQDPTKGGRPKKIYTILKEHGYSKDDIRTAFNEIAWYTLAEAEEAHADKTKPLIVKIVAGQYIEAFKRKEWSRIKDILEHTIGKPRQEIGIEADPEILPTNFIVNGKKPE